MMRLDIAIANPTKKNIGTISKRILKSVSAVLCLIIVTSMFVTYARANDSDISLTTNNQYCSYSYSSIAFGNNRFVAVGFGGAIKTSEDGVNWVKRESGTPYWLRRVIWSGKMFVAVGYGYSPWTSKPQAVIITSVDGLKWQTKELIGNTNIDIRLGGIAYSGKMYVAVGQGAAYYSKDGVRWNITTGISGLEDVVWANGSFTAVGYDYSNYKYPKVRIAYSKDGIKWTKVNVNIKSSLKRIVWTGKKYIAVGREGLIITSSNGTSWKQVTSGVSFELCEIIYNGKVYLASGMGQQIIYSADSITWKSSNIRANDYIYGIAWGKNQFVAAGSSNAENIENFLNSTDGLHWKQKNTSNAILIDGIGFDSNRKLYLVFLKDIYGFTTALESPDGVKWEKYKGVYTDLIPYKSGGVSKVAYNGSIYVKVDDYMKPLKISSDGIKWDNIETPYGKGLTSIIWTGQLFVAAGYDGNIMTSPDGTNWIKYKVGNSILRDIAFSGEIYLAIGDCGEAAISKDGKTWAYKCFSNMAGINRVIWDGNSFIAAGEYGVLFRSEDAINWDVVQTPTGCDLIDVIFEKGKYLIRSTGDFTIGS